MRNHSFLILVLYLLAAVVSARAQPQNAHYVCDGKTVQVTDEELALAKYKRWQIWLYQEGVRIPGRVGPRNVPASLSQNRT